MAAGDGKGGERTLELTVMEDSSALRFGCLTMMVIFSTGPLSSFERGDELNATVAREPMEKLPPPRPASVAEAELFLTPTRTKASLRSFCGERTSENGAAPRGTSMGETGGLASGRSVSLELVGMLSLTGSSGGRDGLLDEKEGRRPPSTTGTRTGVLEEAAAAAAAAAALLAAEPREGERPRASGVGLAVRKPPAGLEATP